MRLARLALLALAFLVNVGAFAADARPVGVQKITGADEDYDADVDLFGDGYRRLRVEGLVTVLPAPSTFGTIFRRQEITVATKVETDLPSGSYTVPAGKTFILTSISANYDTQSPLVVRLKKQTGGAGSFVTEWRLTLKQHGQDNSNVQFTIPFGSYLGTAGDVLKLTYESALSKGTLWASFTGVEY